MTLDHCLYCEKPIYCRGVCHAHYQRARRAQRLDLLPAPRTGHPRTAQGRPHGARDRTPRVARRTATWYAAAFRLRREGATRREIAVALGKSYRTVQVALNRMDRELQ